MIRSEMLVRGVAGKILSAAVCGAMLSLAGSAWAADYEPAGKVPAARYLPEKSMAGAEWKVAAEAENDGAVNTYVVESRFGNFDARGRAKVGIRAREIDALVQLEEVSKSDVFVDAVKESALGSVNTVMQFATKPVDTVKAIPGAVGRWFKKTNYQVKETYVDVQQSKQEHDVSKADQKEKEAAASVDPEAAAALEKEKAAKKDQTQDQAKALAHEEALSYLKISSSERRWYAKLGVDPYTDNQILRAVVTSYARVEGLTRFGMKFAGIPGIPGAREIRQTMNLVWETDPWELRMRNRKALLAGGLSEETARAFEDNPYLSLTQQTAFVVALQKLEGVKGRQHLIARVIDLKSKDEGQALFQSTLLLARHHHGQRPLAEILEGVHTPVARTVDGRLLVVLSADALFWTEGIAEAARGLAEIYRGDAAKIRELWVVGDGSPRFKQEAKQLGWLVYDRWEIAAPEDQETSASK